MKLKFSGFGLGNCIEKIISSSKLAVIQTMEKLVGGVNKKKAWKHKQIYENDDSSANKRPKIDGEKEWPFQKKKVAMLLVYSGKGYLGMQRNPGFPTIESDLLDAFVKAGIVRPDHIERPGAKMGFQRAARTDKGVSAAGQVVSLKMFVDVDDCIAKINQSLPEQIRVLGVKRVTKGFDCKNACSARTYIYVTPTFAFAPIDQLVSEDYRITKDVLQKIQETLDCFCGTRNFHNYTSGKKPSDASARRYIMDFKVGEPFVRDDIEYVTLTIKGQSFMMHQIRKMTGMTMAIIRGFTKLDILKDSWKADKLDIPKAPGLGLMLSQLHYDCYNRKFGNDGVHKEIEWKEYEEQIADFKEKFIFSTIYKTEKEDKSMLNWLSTLPLHHYGVPRQDRSPFFEAHQLVHGKTNQMPAEIPDEEASLEECPKEQNVVQDTKAAEVTEEERGDVQEENVGIRN